MSIFQKRCLAAALGVFIIAVLVTFITELIQKPIPITVTHVGTYRTHRGNYRTYYETHHTSVIIPVRRRYRLGQLELAAVDSASASATESHPQRLAKLAIWMADITANGPMVFHDRPWLVAEAMLEWGQTNHWRTDYNAAIKAQRE